MALKWKACRSFVNLIKANSFPPWWEGTSSASLQLLLGLRTEFLSHVKKKNCSWLNPIQIDLAQHSVREQSQITVRSSVRKTDDITHPRNFTSFGVIYGQRNLGNLLHLSRPLSQLSEKSDKTKFLMTKGVVALITALKAHSSSAPDTWGRWCFISLKIIRATFY